MLLIDKKSAVLNEISAYLVNDKEDLALIINKLLKRTEKVTENLISEGFKFNNDIENIGKLNRNLCYKNPLSIIIEGKTIAIQSDYFRYTLLDQVFKYDRLGKYDYGVKPKTTDSARYQIFKIIEIELLHSLKWQKNFSGDDLRHKKVLKEMFSLCLENAGFEAVSRPTFDKYYNKSVKQ